MEHLGLTKERVNMAASDILKDKVNVLFGQFLKEEIGNKVSQFSIAGLRLSVMAEIDKVFKGEQHGSDPCKSSDSR